MGGSVNFPGTVVAISVGTGDVQRLNLRRRRYPSPLLPGWRGRNSTAGNVTRINSHRSSGIRHSTGKLRRRRPRLATSTPPPPRTLRATRGVYYEIAAGSRVAHLVDGLLVVRRSQYQRQAPEIPMRRSATYRTPIHVARTTSRPISTGSRMWWLVASWRDTVSMPSSRQIDSMRARGTITSCTVIAPT